jgi:ATP-dependent DNA helicase RecG
VEVTNPGGVPKGITKENFGVTSVTRNPVIASLLHRVHYIERMGSGIMKMNSAMEAEGRSKPIYQTEGFFFKVIFEREELYGPNGIIDGAKYKANGAKDVVKDDVNVVKDVVYDVNDVANGATDGVNESQAVLLDFIKQDGQVTIPQMAQHLGVGTRQTQRLLKPLVDGGFVTRSGGRRQGVWQVAEPTIPYRRST